MPQKDKDVRKEYNRQKYLKRMQSQLEKPIEKPVEEPIENKDNTFYLLRHHKQIQIVNNEYLNVKLKPINNVRKSCFPDELLNEIRNLDKDKVKHFINYFNKVAILDGFCGFKYKDIYKNGKHKYRFDSSGSSHFYCA